MEIGSHKVALSISFIETNVYMAAFSQCVPIIPPQLSTASLEKFDWPRAYRKEHLYFDKSLEPETGSYLDCFLRVLGIADSFKII